MNTRSILAIGILLFAWPLANAQDSAYVEIWYGNLDGSPIIARPGQLVNIDVYARTDTNVFVGGFHLCLGAQKQYIDSMVSAHYGVFYPPINQWDDYSFLVQQPSTLDSANWICQSFLGWSDLGGPPNPVLYSTEPIQIMTFAVRAAYDTMLIGDTIICLGIGRHRWLGQSYAWDSIGNNLSGPIEHFSPLYFVQGEQVPCIYMPGDINGDSSVGGSDVTYGVSYFKSRGSVPPDSCFNISLPGSRFLYVAGDINGNCEFRGSDITRLVAYFKGRADIKYCHWFPPSGRR